MIDRLSKYILLNLLKTWLNIDELGHFDSAVCNRHLRIKWTTLLESHSLIHANDYTSIPVTKSFIMWIIGRNLSIDRLNLCEKHPKDIDITATSLDALNISCLTQLKIHC